MFNNWRFHPFLGTMNSVSISNEEHLVEYHNDCNMYGLQLHEAPKLDSPSSVVIVEDVTGGATFTEVPRTQAPSSGEYRVDYDAAGYYGTGRIEFNPADVGKSVLVSYRGNGYVVKNQYSLGQTVIPASLEVIEDTQLDGDAVIDGTLNVKGDVDLDQDLNVDGNTVIDGTITASHLIGGIKETGLGAGILHFKTINIGDWNMVSTGIVSIPHGIDQTKIRFIFIGIRGDSGTVFENSLFTPDFFAGNGSPSGGYRSYSNNIDILRVVGGIFDSSDFDATSYNRGWIIIGYID